MGAAADGAQNLRFRACVGASDAGSGLGPRVALDRVMSIIQQLMPISVDPPRSLILGSPSLLPGQDPAEQGGEPPWRDTWAFALEPIGDDATQVIARVRAEYAMSVKLALVTSFMSAAHAVMGRTQLRNIKRRAERLAVVG
jgi:hypothetical protein